MAQRRMIYAQLAENQDFASMSDKAQKTYIFLIVLADDDGRLKGDSDWLRIKIFPYDPKIKKENMQSFLKEIVKARLIVWYKAEEKYFIQHPNWTKFQILRADRKKDSDIPQPSGNQVATKRARKLSKDKVREENSTSLYLKNIPSQDLEEFYKRFETSRNAIKSKAEDLFLWLESEGKAKKNYKSFLLNALKKDFTERKPETEKKTVTNTAPDMLDTPESAEKRKQAMGNMRKDLENIGVLKKINE